MSTLTLPVVVTNQHTRRNWLKGCLAIGVATVTMATIAVVAVTTQNTTDTSGEIRSIHDDVGLEMKAKLFWEVRIEGRGKTTYVLILSH